MLSMALIYVTIAHDDRGVLLLVNTYSLHILIIIYGKVNYP